METRAAVAVSGASVDPGRTRGPVGAYHLELRQFPHNVCHFNLTEQQLRTTVVEPWAREQWIELGDRKWSPHQAKLTVIEGPPIPLQQLSMGRGWRTAQRQGQDVTARVLAAAREGISGDAHALPADAGQSTGDLARQALGDVTGHALQSAEIDLLADSLGLELLALLGAERARLRRAWELAGVRYPERSAGECLMLAERAVASLLRSRLVVLTSHDSADVAGQRLDDGQAQVALRAIDSWSGEDASSVWVRKA